MVDKKWNDRTWLEKLDQVERLEQLLAHRRRQLFEDVVAMAEQNKPTQEDA